VFRNKRRTLLTSIVIAVSVSAMLFMFGYMKGVLTTVIEDSIKIFGQISIKHDEYKLKERMLSLNASVDEYSAIKAKLDTINGISDVAGRIKFGGLIDFNEKNEPGLGMGIDIVAEKNILTIQNSLVKGSYFTGKENESIIGTGIATELNLF